MESTPLTDLGKGHVRQGRYLLAVQTGAPAFDRLVYEHCIREFGRALTIVEQGEYDGTVEVFFTSSAEGYTSSTTFVAANASLAWYSAYPG